MVEEAVEDIIHLVQKMAGHKNAMSQQSLSEQTIEGQGK